MAALWRSIAPSIDFLTPDIYFGDFRRICQRYEALTGALFIPEMRRNEEGVGDAFVAVGSFATIGVSSPSASTRSTALSAAR